MTQLKKTLKLLQSSKSQLVTKLKKIKLQQIQLKLLRQKIKKLRLQQNLYYDKTPKAKI